MSGRKAYRRIFAGIENAWGAYGGDFEGVISASRFLNDGEGVLVETFEALQSFHGLSYSVGVPCLGVVVRG